MERLKKTIKLSMKIPMLPNDIFKILNITAQKLFSSMGKKQEKMFPLDTEGESLPEKKSSLEEDNGSRWRVCLRAMINNGLMRVSAHVRGRGAHATDT